ncbi:MAG TPA: FHA domain-containing protein, partial [Candidatus Dormibacteraeota bacterium]|nr:FHA domain-containing protein [Candidatus Dormibacteraeota bacterium]
PDPSLDLSSNQAVLALFNRDPAALGQAGLQRQLLGSEPFPLNIAQMTPIHEESGVALMGLIDAGSQATKLCAIRGPEGELRTDSILLIPADEDAHQAPDNANPMLRAVIIEPKAGPTVLGRDTRGAGRLGLGVDTVSRKHFSIELDQAGIVKIQDLNSFNGTKLITRPQPEEGGRRSRMLSAAKRAGMTLLGGGKRSADVASKQPAKPESEKPTAGLDPVYDRPADQVAFEMELVDNYRQQFPEAELILRQALADLQSVTSELNPDSDKGASNLMLKMPDGISKAELDAMSEIDRSEALVSTQGVTLIDDNLPPETRAVMDGLYGLTGATEVNTRDDPLNDRPAFDYVLRRGMYHGKEIYFQELYIRNNARSRGGVMFTASIVGKRSQAL